MPKQLTLFGKRASAEPYFKNPKNDYEPFVNKAWEENNEKYGKMQDFLQDVLKKWGEMKNESDALKRYLEHRPPPAKKIVWPNFVNVIAKSSRPATNVNPLIARTTTTRSSSPPLPSTCARVTSDDCRQLPNVANVPRYTSKPSQYLESHEYELTKTFMAEIGFIERDEFFTDDIINDESLMKTLASLSYSWNIFSFLRKSYRASVQKPRKSNLKVKLQLTLYVKNWLIC